MNSNFKNSYKWEMDELFWFLWDNENILIIHCEQMSCYGLKDNSG